MAEATARVDESTATHIRSCHPYSFRSGEWARILTTVESYGRPCWLVEFDDGRTDWMPKDDPDGQFEYR